MTKWKEQIILSKVMGPPGPILHLNLILIKFKFKKI